MKLKRNDMTKRCYTDRISGSAHTARYIWRRYYTEHKYRNGQPTR